MTKKGKKETNFDGHKFETTEKQIMEFKKKAIINSLPQSKC